MSSALKALVIVLVALAVLAIAAVGIGMWWWSKHGLALQTQAKTARAEGSAFGRDTDERGCLAEALRRVEGDSGFRAGIAASMFVTACLETGATSEGFCDEVPPTSEILTGGGWRAARCREAGLDATVCGTILKQVQSHCDARRATPVALS
ncbi:MAG: hypothetical protein ACRD6R_10280 [Candidatus Polarisedimenticolia bacterium]